jgi:hypothetical protein
MQVCRYLLDVWRVGFGDRLQNNSICLRPSVSNNPMSQGFCCFLGRMGSAASVSTVSFIVRGLTPLNTNCNPCSVRSTS